jgi:hypothetical protein
MRTEWEGEVAQLREAGRQLQISVIGMPLEESTPSEYRRKFAEIPQHRPDAIMVGREPSFFPSASWLSSWSRKAVCRLSIPFVNMWSSVG